MVKYKKVTDESVQKEIDINTEVLGIVNGEITKVWCIFVCCLEFA